MAEPMKQVVQEVAPAEGDAVNPVLERVLAEVKKAAQGGGTQASSHSSYVSGVFEEQERD
jgi:hypothetical protein